MGIAERKEREKELRRLKIQEAAKKVFLEKDFQTATIEDIAREAELSAGTIYLYFRNKDELYASLNLKTLQYWFNETEKIYKDNNLSAEDKILRFKDAMYNTFLSDPLNMRTIFHVQLNTISFLSSGLLSQLNHLARNIMTMMADVYEEGVRQGKFRRGHSMVYADIMWGIFAGLVIWEGAKISVNPKKDFFKSTLDVAFDIFCRGIKTRNKTA